MHSRLCRSVWNIPRLPPAQLERRRGGEHRISWKEATANAALICFLRNNAHHYLSLMDEVERLREERDFLLAKVWSCRIMQLRAWPLDWRVF